MKLNWSNWLYHLWSAIIGGGAGAVTSAVSSVLIAPNTFNLSSWAGARHVLSMMVMNFVVSGAFSMFFYLKQSPLPPDEDAANKPTP